ncbi:MAG: hypothetical protein KTR30_12620 [Saprospiraceae bacterium]|nr:hypothetical protein [Saprospiraceae bacterium]
MIKPLHLFWQIPALTISLFVCFAIGGILSGLAETASTSTGPSTQDQAAAMAAAASTAGMLLLSCFLTSLILAFWLYFMQWHGWKAVLTVFLVYFTANSILTQIESLFFNSALKIPSAMIGKIIFSGFIISVLYAPISVGIMQRMRSKYDPIPTTLKLNSKLIKAICWIALLYTVIYFVFGYYVAWQSAAVREFYSGSTDILPFGTHMLKVVQGEPSLIFFQLFRGVIWAGLAILIAESVGAVWWIKALLTGLIFGVMLAGGLLLPNPFMPSAVRWPHLWETSISNFLFGFLAIYLLHRLAWQKNSNLAQTD